MKQYQEQKQFHVNVYYNSSWCLFKMHGITEEGAELEVDNGSDQDNEETKITTGGDGDQEMLDEERAVDREEKKKYRPYKFSGKTYTFDVNHERAILDNLRGWAYNYFA